MAITLDRIGVAVPARRTAPPPAPTVCTTPPSQGAVATRPFTTGFCGPGPFCKDVHRSCKGAVRNGSAAAVKVIHCACECHQDASTSTG